MLVVDASVAVAASVAENGLRELGDSELVAPSLMWSEARSALRLRAWHGRVTTDDAETMRTRLEGAPVQRMDPPELGDAAWRVADELGWARTYDAEYVALARLLGCRLVTLDERLWRGTRRLGIVVAPHELHA
jgi:predicted nucleic acid-binding protein